MTERTERTDRYATASAGTAPAFSLDGTTVFHLCGAGAPALWAMRADGTGERLIAAPDEKVAFLRRAPKDDRLVFGIDAGGDERQQLWLVDGGAVRPLTEVPSAIHDFGAWSPDGTSLAYTANDRDEAHFDVIVRPVGGEPRRVHHGTHQLAVAAWHPAGDRLALLADEAEGDQVLSILHLADGRVQPVPHPRPAAFRSVRWARDGSHLIALSDGGGAFLSVCRVDPEQGTVTPWASAAGADIEAWSLSPDGTTLATVSNDRGYGVLRVGPPDGERPAVAVPPGVVNDLAWSADSTALAFSASTATQPPGLFVFDGQLRTLWQPEAPPAVPFALVDWPAEDGRAIPGWFATPSGLRPPAGWPTVVWVHGGPAAQARATWRPDMQMLLDQGYAVLMPNVRGSTGYGRASTASDDGTLRLDSVHDLAAAHRWLTVQPGLDPARIGIMGQSYGGYMVLAAITEYPALWRAAVDYYGIADFVTLLGQTGPWRRAHRSREYGDPESDAALFARISPIHRAERITAPLLVLHGTRDPRVPYGESEQIVAALQGRGHPVQFETFGYAGHGFIRREDRTRSYAAVAAFFGRTL